MFLSNNGRFKRSKFCFQISKFPKIWKSQGCVLPNYFQNFGCYWGPENSEPLASRFFEPFPICVKLAHKGDIRASYAVPQVAFNSRGSLKFFSCGTEVQLECPENKPNIAAARETYLQQHLILALPLTPAGYDSLF